MKPQILNQEYKISIIMPVYNTEKYFKRCIDSILRQSYKNIELIIVDDCSPGNIKEIAQVYLKNDKRVQLVSHESNKGLFQARLTGADLATGHYIAFIDSDDYVSLDYYHTLLDAILNSNGDIAIGHTVHQTAEGAKYVYNFHESCFYFSVLRNEEVQNAYFGQKGLCYAWHTIWNKLYSKELWDKCMPYFLKLKQHIIMTEDIAFSSVLWYFAKNVTTVKNDAYFYCENEEASTNSVNISMQKFKKNLADMTVVFDFVEQFLIDVKAKEQIKRNFHEFRKYYSRMWRNIPKYQFKGNDAIEGNQLLNQFCKDETSGCSEDDNFFSAVKTDWRGGLESLKERIILSNDIYVSFDIFDTLINRPFYEPTDLFELMDKYFEELYSTSLRFKQVRIDSEAIAREKYGKMHPEWQDVTLDEIYDCMEEVYGIPQNIICELKEEEQSLEMEFCGIRYAGKELYEAAMLTGKKVILISDMYLGEDTIKQILAKNRYLEYEKLYVSSKYRLTKNSGDLYRYVKNDLKISDNDNVFHFGDNWQGDYLNSKEVGFNPIFFPKAKEVFENKIQGVCTNNCATIADVSCGNIIDLQKMHQSIGQGIMYAMVSNFYFDNPYRTFNQESDFNIDPYFIGYYLIGMHLIGLCLWMVQQCRLSNVKTIHFLARDGYLPMQAYEILVEKMDNVPKANYLYASRKSVLPGMIESPSDFFNLPVEPRNHSPKTILKVLEFALPQLSDEELCAICQKNGYAYNDIFESKADYLDFIRFFISEFFDEEKLQENRALASEYYSVIKENDITFDMGYSGRIQNAISKLSGRGINALFVHSDNVMSLKMQRLGKFSIFNYYDFIPCISGLLREHLLSDFGAGCEGFIRIDNKVQPVLKDEEKLYQDVFILKLVQQGALDFVKEFEYKFNKYISYIPFRYMEASLPFEGYLKNARRIDQKIFAASYFEDFIYGASSKINIEKFIRDFYVDSDFERKEYVSIQEALESGMKDKSKLSKALFYFALDKNTFGIKMGNELKRRPKIYKLGKKIWHWYLEM